MPFYKIYQPPSSLARLVKHLEVYQANWNEEQDCPLPFITCLANNDQALYFYINDPVKVVPSEKIEIEAPAVVVTGPKDKPVGLLFGKNHLMLKVAFHPTGTYRLLGTDMEQLVNKGLDAERLWGDEIINILQWLRSTSSFDTMIGIVCSFLEKKNVSQLPS